MGVRGVGASTAKAVETPLTANIPANRNTTNNANRVRRTGETEIFASMLCNNIIITPSDS
jgi:hypothetical protein